MIVQRQGEGGLNLKSGVALGGGSGPGPLHIISASGKRTLVLTKKCTGMIPPTTTTLKLCRGAGSRYIWSSQRSVSAAPMLARTGIAYTFLSINPSVHLPLFSFAFEPRLANGKGSLRLHDISPPWSEHSSNSGQINKYHRGVGNKDGRNRNFGKGREGKEGIGILGKVWKGKKE